jgi:predicted esterase
MNEEYVEFNYQTRYFRSNLNASGARAIWFVLHGYGQLASFFSAKFSALEDQGICVIAPEGLSHFYLEELQTRNKTGDTRVGASWMTRENRLMDISNYLTYLDKIYDREVTDPHVPVSILGFSQGAATATRWALEGHASFNRLILWAGLLPPDMDFEAGKRILKTKEVVMVYGDQDPFVTPDRLKEMEGLCQRADITPRIVRFHGAHEIDRSVLEGLI